MFIPPGENIVETKKCRISGEEFVVTDKDMEFYNTLSPIFGGEKYLLPTPTLCPRERQMRRMTWRNYDHFYKNICAVSGQEVVSTYRPGTPYRTVSQEAFWSDSWDPYQYGQRIDFSQTFFDQFHALDIRVPHIVLSVTKSENSAYTNFSVNNRNCYLCCRVAECEECYYSLLLVRSKNCFDCWDIADSEYLYECIRTIKSYHCFYCTDCENCHDSYFLKDCSGCRDCFGSCNLRNARFVFNNEQLSETDYRKKFNQTIEGLQDLGELRAKFLRYCEQFPKKYIIGFSNEDVSGNFLFSSAHIVNSFDVHESENIRYSYGAHNVRDSIDASFGYFVESSIENCGAYAGYAQFFCINCMDNCRDILYSRDCFSGTSHCFGCVSLKKGKHSILNTPYSQEEYEKTVIKLIGHMQSTGEWGGFFPENFSPYAYNESAAQVHFPLTREEVQKRGGMWYEEGKGNNNPGIIPLSIYEYDEKRVGYDVAQKNINELLGATLSCVESGKQYKIVPSELAFYIEHHLPIPRIHPRVRSDVRLQQTLPAELYDRACAECGQPFLTSYAPDRPEKILCENCYRKLVY